MASVERAKKLAKKVVWFPMFGCMVFEIWRFENHEKCWVSAFLRVSNLNISKTVHPNIGNHTTFLASFLSSCHWCHSFLDLRNLKKLYLYRIRDLTIRSHNNPHIARLHFLEPLRNHFLVISYALLPIFGKIMFGQKMLNKPTWEPWL